MQPLEEDMLSMNHKLMILLLIGSGALKLAASKILKHGAAVDVKITKAFMILVADRFLLLILTMEIIPLLESLLLHPLLLVNNKNLMLSHKENQVIHRLIQTIAVSPKIAVKEL